MKYKKYNLQDVYDGEDTKNKFNVISTFFGGGDRFFYRLSFGSGGKILCINEFVEEGSRNTYDRKLSKHPYLTR